MIKKLIDWVNKKKTGHRVKNSGKRSEKTGKGVEKRMFSLLTFSLFYIEREGILTQKNLQKPVMLRSVSLVHKRMTATLLLSMPWSERPSLHVFRVEIFGSGQLTSKIIIFWNWLFFNKSFFKFQIMKLDYTTLLLCVLCTINGVPCCFPRLAS